MIEELKRDWGCPRRLADDPEGFAYACTFASKGATRLQSLSQFAHLPEDILEFWEITAWAELFQDVEYGQWGLRIMTPYEAAKESKEQSRTLSRDFLHGDKFVGHFRGDLDMLLLRCDKKKSDFGTVIVAVPIDPRKNWYRVADSFSEFLAVYKHNEGRKFWEVDRGY